jgi:SAM-dependent methyltransferase
MIAALDRGGGPAFLNPAVTRNVSANGERGGRAMAGDRRAELHGHQITHHREKFAAYLRDGSAEMWLVNDNADYWGCCLPLEGIEPFFRALPPSRVLTVGDGKGGKEAAFFKRLGHHAVATDVCTDVLAEAKQRGIIDNFREEDAEALSFADESFDYVLVKETLHHLTRPYLALYFDCDRLPHGERAGG